MIFIGVIHDIVDQLTQTTVIKHLFSCIYIRFIYKIKYLTQNITIKSESYGFITLIKSHSLLLLNRIFLGSLLSLPTFWFHFFFLALYSMVNIYSSKFIRYLDEGLALQFLALIEI